jgi:hypothetical protein
VHAVTSIGGHVRAQRRGRIDVVAVFCWYSCGPAIDHESVYGSCVQRRQKDTPRRLPHSRRFRCVRRREEDRCRIQGP